MNYTHPKRYKGMKYSVIPDDAYEIFLNLVEANCFRCENFMGSEHDFSECYITGRNGRSKYLQCIYDEHFEHTSQICPMRKCKIEGEE